MGLGQHRIADQALLQHARQSLLKIVCIPFDVGTQRFDQDIVGTSAEMGAHRGVEAASVLRGEGDTFLLYHDFIPLLLDSRCARDKAPTPNHPADGPEVAAGAAWCSSFESPSFCSGC